MPIFRDRKRGSFVFEFDRRIPGAGRVRARKRLPKTWTQAQADEFDRKECARLYALANGGASNALIEDAVARYVIERVPQLKSGKNAAAELAGMAWCYVGRPLSVLPDVVKEYRAKARKEDGSELAPATVRNRIRYLVAACRWGWKEHNMCEHDPAARVKVPQVKNERQVYGDRASMLMVAKAMKNPQARMALRIAFYSGMRLGEIRRAAPKGSVWVLAPDETKNGKPRLVPIHRKVAVCSRRFDRSTPKITIQRSWESAREIVGLQHMHFHDWRHTAASEMINQGVDLFTVGRVLGHEDPRSTKRYSHLATSALEAAVGRIGQKIPHQGSKKKA
jgi:integrase